MMPRVVAETVTADAFGSKTTSRVWCVWCVCGRREGPK